MDYSHTNIEFLSEDLLSDYGDKQGKELYEKACSKYEELCSNEKKYINEAMNNHVFNKILPSIALYYTFLDNGFTKEKSVQLTMKETQKNAERLKMNNKKLTKIPFTYTIFKLFAKSHMKKNFPSEGWDLEWKKYDKSEIHFDMNRCIYSEMCIKYKCPELCVVFCQNDITAFAGYLPKIVFRRQGTIGQGNNKCDFHFMNGKKYLF